MRDRRCPARQTRLALTAALVLAGLGAARPAQARDLADVYGLTGNTFDLQLFHPAIDTKGYITVNASQVLGLWDFSIGVVGTIAGTPFKLKGPNGTSLADDLLVTLPIQATLGFKYAELGISLPVHIMQGSAAPHYQSPTDTKFNNSLAFGAAGLGDLGIHVKGRILNTSKHPVGLAVMLSAWLPYLSKPAGNGPQNFFSDGVFGLHPQVIVDKEFGRSRRVRLAANLGARLRLGARPSFSDEQGQRFMDSGKPVCGPDRGGGFCGTGQVRTLGHQLSYGIGLSGAVIKERFDLLGEIYGAIPLDNSKEAFPFELIAGAKVYLARNSFFTFGGGGSPFNAIRNQTQSADWRLFVGFVFEPAIGDKDGDGLKDDVDKCPAEAEDFDDFADNDGCPEPDNDRDGLRDEDDKCPNEPETKNGFQDDDGCPDEVELDRDGDGVPDSTDKCADDPEDKDNFEDEDGCPEPDNDHDGILDIDDKDPLTGRSCANEPEDKDGFEDIDGCPDPDNDKDRILDVKDSCPNEPEVYNGFQDEDGCPDKGKVIVRRGKIEILDKIYFETDKAIIKSISFPLLEAIAGTLKGNPQILQVEIQGHADERGDDDHNLKLTEDRAASVLQYLKEHGVEPERIQSRGYGETKPVCKDHNEDCWSKNRRSEFVILKRSDE